MQDRMVTILILAISLLVYALITLFGIASVMEWLQFPGYPDQGTYWQLWRYVSPALIHFSLIHIGFNLLWWWILAPIVEHHHGRLAIVKIFLIVAVLSNTAQYLVSSAGFGGLSGVVYGLFGYVWIISKYEPDSGIRVPNAVMVQVGLWLILGFTGWLDALIGPMANMAHFIGFVVGLLLALSKLRSGRMDFDADQNADPNTL